jgi:hypothetical protein
MRQIVPDRRGRAAPEDVDNKGKTIKCRAETSWMFLANGAQAHASLIRKACIFCGREGLCK